jgi:hypothetical protein
MVETIDELSRLARELNQQSDNLNALIMTLNKKLAALNFGVEVWHAEPIEAGDFREGYDDEERLIEKYRGVVVLGYSKVQDTWQLAVREEMWRTDLASVGEREFTVNPDPPSPLLKAPRETRIKALRLVPKLLDDLRDEAKALLNSIGQGKKLAAKLGS